MVWAGQLGRCRWDVWREADRDVQLGVMGWAHDLPGIALAVPYVNED
jgi:hypothetical protein